jgi:hypothetical protein
MKEGLYDPGPLLDTLRRVRRTTQGEMTRHTNGDQLESFSEVAKRLLFWFPSDSSATCQKTHLPAMARCMICEAVWRGLNLGNARQ